MISINSLYIQYGDRILFNRPNLIIEKNEKIALIGRNGAGKSTLLKIIAGKIKPDEGEVSLQKGITLGYLEQDLELNTDTEVLVEAKKAFKEINLLNEKLAEVNHQLEEGIHDLELLNKKLEEQAELFTRIEFLGGSAVESEAEKVLTGLGFRSEDMGRKLNEFSGGWQMRVEIAKLLLRKPSVLLLDEPTNHLDIESIIWLEKYLKNYEGSIVLISHDTQFLNTVCKKTVEIDNGKFYEYKASYYKYIKLREERIAMQTSAFKNQQKVIEQKEKTIKRFMAKANKSKMAQSMQKQLDKIDRISIDSFNSKEMNLRFPEPSRSGRLVVKADCSKSYGSLEVLNNISMEVERGEKIAFVGQNGQGKSTLAKIIVNEIEASKGNVELGHNVSIGYYAQNQSDALNPKLDLLETMEAQASNEQRPKIRSILGGFLFSGEDVEKKVSVLSGGERARLAMALMILEDFNLLILDEPTNHLDIQAKAVLKNTIEKYTGTCIIVSHDRDFLSGLTDRTIEFRDKKLINYLGDVNYFLEKRALDNMRQVELRDKKKKEDSPQKAHNAPQIKFSREELKKMRRKVQYLEREIENIEKEIKLLHEQMMQPDFYKDPSSHEIIQKHHKHKNNLNAKMEQWEMQMEVLEEFVD